MGKRFRSKDMRSGIRLVDKETQYELLIIPDNIPRYLEVYFLTPSIDPLYKSHKAYIPITGRDLRDYPIDGRFIRNHLEAQFIEVGAGLGGFTPFVASLSPVKKPIVIDPVNYNSLGDLLTYAQKTAHLPEKVIRKLSRMKKRQEIITDQSRVRLINEYLGDACRQNPELIGLADYVIDLCGASIYPETEMNKNDLHSPKARNNWATFQADLRFKVGEMEKSLLRNCPAGELIIR